MTPTEEIEKRLAVATPYEWDTQHNETSIDIHCKENYALIASIPILADNAEDNATFIAHAPADIRFLLQALRTAEQALPKWVSVKERLPEKPIRDTTECIVLVDGTPRTDAFGIHGTFLAFEDSVTHWMPLPEPPKGDQANANHG